MNPMNMTFHGFAATMSYSHGSLYRGCDPIERLTTLDRFLDGYGFFINSVLINLDYAGPQR